MRIVRRTVFRFALRLACPMVLLSILAGCSRTPPVEIGSYPAANPNDCLPPIALIDQHSNRITLASLKGKPVLIDFVYASCQLECPVLTSKFRLIADALGPQLGHKITMVSITLDPEHDTPAVLLRYAKAEGAPDSGWLFLTGPPAAIDQELALFRIKRMREPGGAIGHVAAAFLLGPDGHQIRQYDALQVSPKTVVADIGNALNG